MKQKTKGLVMIAFGSTLATVIYLIVMAARMGQPLLVENPSEISPHTASVKTETDHTEAGINQRTKPEHLRPDAGNARYYEVVGPAKGPLALGESVVMDRVKAGLQCLQMGSLPTEEKRITNMREAYMHLMHNASIMAGYEPLWGIEQDKYYVFSGGRDSDPKTAFKRGYAVEKTSGKIYNWWLPKGENQ